MRQIPLMNFILPLEQWDLMRMFRRYYYYSCREKTVVRRKHINMADGEMNEASRANVSEKNKKKTDMKRKLVLSEEEKSELILLWEGEDILYNIEHTDYHNNTKRMAAMKRMAEVMSVDIDYMQVKEYMRSIRTSYLKERRKEEASVSTGKGARQLYRSKWRFYDELSFLAPFTKPVNTESSMSQHVDRRLSDDEEDEDDHEGEIESLLYDDGNELAEEASQGPSTTGSRTKSTGSSRNVKKKRSSADDLLLQASGVLASVVNKRAKTSVVMPPPPPSADNADVLFGKTMAELAKNITDDMAKEMAKIECQQIMVRYRFMNSASNQQVAQFSPALVRPAPISRIPQERTSRYDYAQNQPPVPCQLQSPTYDERYRSDAYSTQSASPSPTPSMGYMDSPTIHQMQNTIVPKTPQVPGFMNILENPN